VHLDSSIFVNLRVTLHSAALKYPGEFEIQLSRSFCVSPGSLNCAEEVREHSKDSNSGQHLEPSNTEDLFGRFQSLAVFRIHNQSQQNENCNNFSNRPLKSESRRGARGIFSHNTELRVMDRVGVVSVRET
jgi:hypothetical protein